LEKEACRILFLPENREVLAPPGTLILDAATRAGVIIDTPCGGQGRCGRCLVRIQEGEATRRENPHLTQKQQQEGWVLACTARVAGDLVLTVPLLKERERVAVESAASRRAAPVPCPLPFYPALRQVFLELPHPTLEDPATDLDRLRRALAQKEGLDRLRVELPNLQRLARTLREGKWQVTLDLYLPDGEARLVDLFPGKKKGPLLGLAVDIGTTNVVMEVVDLRSGRSLGGASARNRQVLRGEDIISRIVYSEKGEGLKELQGLVTDTINSLLLELARAHSFEPGEVEVMVVAGNTTMTHLFLGLYPKPIREEPYIPTTSFFPEVRAGEVGVNINPQAPVYALPAVAAYVGGDITAGVLASCLYRADRLTLFLDVGTNGEIVLGNKEFMTTCACSAGPAFEGAGMRWGMRAIPGAIEEVRIHSTTLQPTLRVIGDRPPQGICGSGLITTLSEMFLTGVMDRAGKVAGDFVVSRTRERPRARWGEHGTEYVLAWAEETDAGEDIVISEVDINSLLRTKAAIYAGIAVLARTLGIEFNQIEQVLIGGAFGQHINVESAIQIGLLPDLPWEKFHFLGNTSLAGAIQVLISKYARAQAEEIARRMTYLELIADNTFMNEMTAALFLPHTDINLFPSVKAQLEKKG